MPISQSPNGNQTINPTDLKTLKYSIKQQNFNSKRGINGDVFLQKSHKNNHTHTGVLLLQNNPVTTYLGITSEVLTKLTAAGLPERFKSPA